MRTTQQIANELTQKKALEQLARYMAKNNESLFTNLAKQRTIKAYFNAILETFMFVIGVTTFIYVLSLLVA